MTPARRRRRAGSASWRFPPDKVIAAKRKQLPRFEPDDLRSLVNEARSATGQSDFDPAFVMALRQRNNNQLGQLLRALNVDQSKPDAWERAFFLLALIHHGVGHFAWYPRKTNKNAAMWSVDHDVVLIKEIFTLRKRGFSDRRAVEKLALDPSKRTLFPYRPKLSSSRAGEGSRRVAALWGRWQKIRSGSSVLSALGEALGLRTEPCGVMAGLLADLDEMYSIPEGLLVKIKSLSKQGDS
jgi:hypothetical protein